MYCETAGHNCEYLDLLNQLGEVAVVNRGISNRRKEKFAGIVEDVAAEWANQSQRYCSQESCGVVKRVITKVVVEDALG